MALILIGIWVGFLAILVKLGVLKKWTLWMKISPLFIWLIFFVVVAIPMNFQAPTGALMVMRESVPISPAVPGTVADVPVSSGEVIQAGTILFSIDDAPYQAAVANLEAQQDLTVTRLEQARTLLLRDAGRKADVQQYESELARIDAQLKGAHWELEQTRVLAPRTGIIPSIGLEAGTQVSPGTPVMTVIDSERYALLGRLAQNYVRHVKPGQKADIVFKLLPGQVIPATVKQLVKANPGGQLSPSGGVIDAGDWSEQSFVVELQIAEDVEIPELPAGAYGTVAVYTADMSSVGELIRAIMLRTETWLNFL